MQATGKFAKLPERHFQLGRGPVERRRQPRVGATGLGLGELEGQCQRDEALLGAVVEIAFDPAPLGVTGGHDPGAGCADVLELGADLGLERSLSSAKRAAADTDPSSSGCSISAGSWISSATVCPSRSSRVTARSGSEAAGISSVRPSRSTKSAVPGTAYATSRDGSPNVFASTSRSVG